MAKRAVFTPSPKRPFYKQELFDVDWQPGVSVSQKMKNSASVMEQWKEKHPGKTILEVSTKSDKEEGKALSPFNLTKKIESLKKSFPVENIYHAAKVFREGGPYVDLLGTDPVSALKDSRLQDSGDLKKFVLEGKEYPISPMTLFFNWLYIKALLENPHLAKALDQADAYSDIEYNPETGINCQARACALYQGLKQAGLLSKAKTFEGFKELILLFDLPEEHKPGTAKKLLPSVPKPSPRTIFQKGDWLYHPSIGRGQVVRKDNASYTINFRISGPRTIKKEFVETSCKKID